MREALYHGTIPLLFWNLSRLAPDDVPKTTLNQLKASSNAIACWNLSLTGELLKLLNLFRERGIRALPLKGPALAAAAYGNLSLRQFCDLDILVPKEDMLKAKEVLMSAWLPSQARSHRRRGSGLSEISSRLYVCPSER